MCLLLQAWWQYKHQETNMYYIITSWTWKPCRPSERPEISPVTLTGPDPSCSKWTVPVTSLAPLRTHTAFTIAIVGRVLKDIWNYSLGKYFNSIKTKDTLNSYCIVRCRMYYWLNLAGSHYVQSELLLYHHTTTTRTYSNWEWRQNLNNIKLILECSGFNLMKLNDIDIGNHNH